jgi:hypothetical protein
MEFELLCQSLGKGAVHRKLVKLRHRRPIERHDVPREGMETQACGWRLVE